MALLYKENQNGAYHSEQEGEFKGLRGGLLEEKEGFVKFIEYLLQIYYAYYINSLKTNYSEV